MIPIVTFTDPKTVRLISAAYITEPAVAPLADGQEELDILNALEGMTSARTGTAGLPPGVDPAELLHSSYGFGHTHINAAFCHVRPPGNRFNSEDRGAWYCAFGADAKATSKAEVIFHRTRALMDAGCLHDKGMYRELLAGFTTEFYDLRDSPDHPSLQSDTALAYPIGQGIAKTIIADGGNGVLYPSVRNPGGQCIAVFRPSVIQNVKQGDQITFEWTGSATPTVVETA